MPGFVIRDTITGEFITSSSSAKIDHKDRRFAKVYGSRGAARGAATGFQRQYDFWHECRQHPRNTDRGPANEFLRNFVVEEA